MENIGIKVIRNKVNSVVETNKKDFNFIDTSDAHKIIFANFVVGGSYDHNLMRIPQFTAFGVDSAGTPFEFTIVKDPRTTNSRITNLPNPAYLIIYQESK